MTGHGGRRRATPTTKSPSPVLMLVRLVGGAVVGAAAWFFLVRAAIDFGSTAKDGEPLAWAFLGLAGIGAVACLALVLVLAARLLNLLGIGVRKPGATGSVTGGHRHARK